MHIVGKLAKANHWNRDSSPPRGEVGHWIRPNAPKQGQYTSKGLSQVVG
jgi:hypothetical protein